MTHSPGGQAAWLRHTRTAAAKPETPPTAPTTVMVVGKASGGGQRLGEQFRGQDHPDTQCSARDLAEDLRTGTDRAMTR